MWDDKEVRGRIREDDTEDRKGNKGFRLMN